MQPDLKEKPASVKAANSKLLQKLNKEQAQAVTYGDGPLLIIAGAGTGKTTVLTKRIVWLIEQGLAKSDEILALTFTEKASAEMAGRVDELMQLGYAEISISTFHAFAQTILKDHGLDIGLPADFKVLTETAAWLMVHKHLAEFELDYYRPMGNPTRFIHALLDHFDKAKREGISPETYLKYVQDLELLTDSPVKTKRKKSQELAIPDPTEIKRVKELTNAYHKYQKMILDAGFLDYNDLISYSLQLLKTRPKILAEYRAKYRYILVDEFQDTDLAQYELVKLLAEPRNNLTVVGDDDQSIYKFRGASTSNFQKFEQDFPKLSKISLIENYRSGQVILDFAYKFIQANTDRLETRSNISKQLKSTKPEPGTIEVIHADTGHNEAQKVADKIQELMNTGGYKYDDFAILARANDHADAFLSELGKRQIPFTYLANRGLYKKPFILDLLAYLKILENYHDNESLFRVLQFPKFRIATPDLIELTRATKRKNWSVYDAIRQVPMAVKVSVESQQALQEFLKFTEKHTHLARTARATEMIVRMLNDLAITKDLLQHSDERSEDIVLLQKFYAKAQEFEQDSDGKTLKAFLGQIQLEQQSGDNGELAFDPNVGPETVKIMTIHTSKGLEFRCVFVVNMVDARFPSRDRKEPIELPTVLVKEIFSEGDVHLMEERRLFYVAATRAKDKLFLTWADNYGGAQMKNPSRFLIETGLEAGHKRAKPMGEVKFESATAIRTKSELIVPETFSWSSISSFLKCPLEFKYRYLYQIPWPGNGYTSFGSTVHKAIQLYSQILIQSAGNQNGLFGGKKGEVKYPPLQKLYELYDENWIDEWYETKADQERFRQRGYRLLENFYQKLSGSNLVPKETEKFFKLKLGDYKYVGVIDCMLGNSDGTIDLIDYKTTARPRQKLDKVDKKQLLSYQLAAQEFFKKPVRHMSYWDLEDLSDVIEFVGTPQDLAEIKSELTENIAEIVEAIRHDSFRELDLKKSHDCEFRDLES